MSERTLRVLTWNLYHGRSVPGVGRSLLSRFSAALAGWEWEVALLQEVPPWWPAQLAAAAEAQQRTALTSRNWAPWAQRRLAERFPDVLKSSGGGANAILVRGEILAHRRARLRLWPERRVVHGVALGGGSWGGGGWVANVHASVRDPDRASAEIPRAAALALGWAGEGPVVLGGDFNVRQPRPPGLTAVASTRVDHVFARGWCALGPGERLDAGCLSDHVPLAVTLRAEPGLPPR